MTNQQIAALLKQALEHSYSQEYWDDDIQPSARKKYDGNKLGFAIENLIYMLEVEE